MLIILDFSNLAYYSFFSSLKEYQVDVDSCPSNYNKHIYSFHRKVTDILTLFSYEKYYFALDRRPVNKYKIYADYKKGRKKLPLDIKKPLLDLIEQWESLAIYSEDNEADDAIAAFVANNTDKEIIVVTTDKDLWQLCGYKHAKVYNFDTNIFITKAEVEKSYKLSDYKLIGLHKCLWGDSSDNVPNVVPRMQRQLLPILELSDGTLNGFLAKVEENRGNLSDRCLELLDGNIDGIKRNYELVRLRYECGYKAEQLQPKSIQEEIDAIPW